MSQPTTRHRRRWLRWTIAAVVLLVVIFVGGPFVYIHFIEGTAPPKLALPKNQTVDVGSAPLSGTWHVAGGSVVGYRVNEVLFGQNNTAVGRTSSVTGQAMINGTTVESGKAAASRSFTTRFRTTSGAASSTGPKAASLPSSPYAAA